MTRGRPAHSQGDTVYAVTAQQRATIVRQLADGADRETVAVRMRIPYDAVMRVATAHGWPRRESLALAAGILEGKVAAEAAPNPTRVVASMDGTATGPLGPFTVRADGSVVQNVETRAPSGDATQWLPSGHPAAAPASADTEGPQRIRTVADLLTIAARSADEATRTLAFTVRADLTDLTARVAAEQGAAHQPPAPPAPEVAPYPLPPAADIRLWAAGAGIECNSHGKVPFAVVAAYTAAHPLPEPTTGSPT